MIDPFYKFNLMNSRVMTNAIFSQGSQGGQGRSVSQDGIQLDLFGRQASPVNRFRAPGKDSEKKTNGTCGRSSTNWLQSADLQLSLENKLHQKMVVNGFPEYKLTWKRWDIPARPPICRLQASVRRTSGIDYFGWHTPHVPREHDSDNSESTYLGKQVTGWATPKSRDTKSEKCSAETIKKIWDHPRGKDLSKQAQLVGWPTPNAMKGGQTSRGGKRKNELLISGLIQPSSNAPTEKREGCLAGWPTPAKQNADAGPNPKGNTGNYFTLQTAAKVISNTTLKLNPLFSLWLMGYPAEWACLKARETV
jgi:hypothetical protein